MLIISKSKCYHCCLLSYRFFVFAEKYFTFFYQCFYGDMLIILTIYCHSSNPAWHVKAKQTLTKQTKIFMTLFVFAVGN